MAVADYFLKIDAVVGESADAAHKGEIDIVSFSFTEHQQGNQSTRIGRGAGKVKMGTFNFTMRANKASLRIMLACATGEHFQSAVLTVRKAGGQQQEFMKITLSGVLISAYHLNGVAGAA